MEQSRISSVDLLREMIRVLEQTIKPEGEILLCSFQSRQAVLELRSILKISKLPFPPDIARWVCPQILSTEILWKARKPLRIISSDYYEVEQLLRRFTKFESLLKKFRPIQIVEIGETIGLTFIRQRLSFNQGDEDQNEQEQLTATSQQSSKYQHCRGDEWEHLKLKALHDQKCLSFDGFDLQLNQEVSLDFYFTFQDAENNMSAHYLFQENSLVKGGIRTILTLKYFVLDSNQRVFVAVKEQIKENLNEVITKEELYKSQQPEHPRLSSSVMSPQALLSTLRQLSEVVKSIHKQGYLIKNLSATSIVYSTLDQCYKLDNFRYAERICQESNQSIAEGVIGYCDDYLSRAIKGCLINDDGQDDLKASELFALGRVFELYIEAIQGLQSHNANDEYQESRLLIKTLMSSHSEQFIDSLQIQKELQTNSNYDNNTVAGFVSVSHPSQIPEKPEFNRIQVAGTLHKIGMVDQAAEIISQIEKDISSLEEENLIELMLFFSIIKADYDKAIFYCKRLCDKYQTVIGSEAQLLKLLKQQSQQQQQEQKRQQTNAQQQHSGELFVEDSREEIDYDHKSSLLPTAKSQKYPQDVLKSTNPQQHPRSTELLMLEASVCLNSKDYKEALKLAEEALANIEFFIGSCFEDLFFDEIVDCYLLLGEIQLKSNTSAISSAAWYFQSAVRLLKDQEIAFWKNKNRQINNIVNDLDNQRSEHAQLQPLLSKNQRLADAYLKLSEVYEIAGDDTRFLFALAEVLKSGSFEVADHARILLQISRIFGRFRIFEKQQEYLYEAFKLAEDDKNMKFQSEFQQVLQEKYPAATEFTNYLATLAQNY